MTDYARIPLRKPSQDKVCGTSASVRSADCFRESCCDSFQYSSSLKQCVNADTQEVTDLHTVIVLVIWSRIPLKVKSLLIFLSQFDGE